MKKQNWKLNVKEKTRKVLSVIMVIFFVALLIRTETVSKWVADTTGWDQEAIRDWGATIQNFALAAGLIVVGVVVLGTLPWVGTAFAIAGGLILAAEAIDKFFPKLMID